MLLVNRGWIPADGAQTAFPKIPAPARRPDHRHRAADARRDDRGQRHQGRQGPARPPDHADQQRGAGRRLGRPVLGGYSSRRPRAQGRRPGTDPRPRQARRPAHGVRDPVVAVLRRRPGGLVILARREARDRDRGRRRETRRGRATASGAREPAGRRRQARAGCTAAGVTRPAARPDCPGPIAGNPRGARAPAHRGLRPHRRPADRRAGRQGRVRSTGCACPASTRRPASPPCSATRTTATGGSRPRAARHLHPPRATAATRSSWTPSGRPPTGAVRVTDFMPQRDQAPDVVRDRRGRLAARSPMRSDAAAALRLRPRRAVGAPDRRPPGGRRRPRRGLAAQRAPGAHLGRGLRARTRTSPSRAGEQVAVRPHLAPLARSRARRSIDPYEALRTRPSRTGRRGPRSCTLRRARTGTPCVRSLITLKALTYAPDRRHRRRRRPPRCPRSSAGCATGTTATAGCATPPSPSSALLARRLPARRPQAWRDWLLRAVAGDPADLQIMYGVAGERRLPECELPWLPGYEGSRPVRIGNARRRPAPARRLRRGHRLAAPGPRSAGLADRAARLAPAARADGLPGDRLATSPTRACGRCAAPRRHFVHSKVMAWVAADRAVRTVEASPSCDGTVDRWRALRDEVHARGVREGLRPASATPSPSPTARAELDAALLLIPPVGFLPPDDPRVVGTVDAVRAELDHDGFVRRYSTDDDGASTACPASEGAFLACSFWLADALHADGPHGGGAGAVRAAAGAAQRRRAARRGVRPGGRPPARQLPAGVQPRRPGEHRPRPVRGRTEAG